MKKIIIALSAFLLAGAASAQQANTKSMDELLKKVYQAGRESSAENKRRIAEFKQKRDQQQRLLNEARAALRAQEQRSERLKAEYDANEKELADLETVLHERSGNLGEMQGTIKILAGDLRSQLEHSLTSAQYPDRIDFLAELASKKELPTIDDIHRLWYEMQREITESGKIVKFKTDILNAEGIVEKNQEAARLGVFDAFDKDGNFLILKSPDEEGGLSKPILHRLKRQPDGRWLALSRKFVQTPPNQVTDVPVDYTRGTILQLVVQTPSLWEKVKEGGIVGYVILSLGAIGLLVALWKFLQLLTIGRKIKRQLKSKQPREDNPLGRIMKVYTENPDADIETMELKLDEAILRETAPLESGLSFIKVLYVIAPLLGLLGTVVGMIQTFQMITLFGTGDPKSMAGGISMALVTTVLGLVVAIPLTVLHSILQSMARKQTQILEEQSAGIIARMAEK